MLPLYELEEGKDQFFFCLFVSFFFVLALLLGSFLFFSSFFLLFASVFFLFFSLSIPSASESSPDSGWQAQQRCNWPSAALSTDPVELNVDADSFCHVDSLVAPILRKLRCRSCTATPRPAHGIARPFRDEAVAERQGLQKLRFLRTHNRTHHPADDVNVDHRSSIVAHFKQHALDLILDADMASQGLETTRTARRGRRPLIDESLELRQQFVVAAKPRANGGLREGSEAALLLSGQLRKSAMEVRDGGF